MSQIVSFFSALAMIPLLSRYLTSELFGLWMLLTNFVSFLVFADLGVGVGLRNQLMRCFADDSRDEPGTWVANALLLMLAMSAVLVITALIALPAVPLDRWLGVSSGETKRWLLPSVQSMMIAFAIGLPAMLLEYIGNAYQRGYWVYGLIAIGRIAGLVGILGGIYADATFPILVVVYVAAPHILCLLGLLTLWLHVPWMRPNFKGLSYKRTGQLLNIGIGMLGVRVTHALAMQGPAYVTAFMQGLGAAGIVSVIQKVLVVPSMLSQSIQTGTQGAVGEAVYKGEWVWVKRNLLTLTRVNSVIFIVTTIVAVSLGGRALNLLLGQTGHEPSRLLLFLYCLYSGLSTLRFPFGTFLTIVDRVYTQSMYRFVALLITFGVAWAFDQTIVSIIAIFVVLCEVPTLLCTVSEAGLVIRKSH